MYKLFYILDIYLSNILFLYCKLYNTMLSLENICVNKVLDVQCEKYSDNELLELREMSYEQRIIFFEENVMCHPVAVLLAKTYTVNNYDVPPIMEQLYPWKLGSPNTNIHYEEIKRAMFNENLAEVIRLLPLTYNSSNITVLDYVIALITFAYMLLLEFVKFGNKHENSIQVIKDKLLVHNLDIYPTFRIKMLNLLEKLN